MFVAIYVRISQENPDGYSLADQEQRCRQHAEAQGWTVSCGSISMTGSAVGDGTGQRSSVCWRNSSR
jgi:DNA invertase Pin-like site-specific DNA recombinase